MTDAEEVHRLNLEFRGIDRTTDVLSFPGLDFEEPAAFEDSIDEGCINPDNDCVMLGDIVINAEKVKEQAAEYGHSEMREFAFLIAHSMLHLCGYDHMTPEEAEVRDRRRHLRRWGSQGSRDIKESAAWQREKAWPVVKS